MYACLRYEIAVDYLPCARKSAQFQRGKICRSQSSTLGTSNRQSKTKATEIRVSEMVHMKGMGSMIQYPWNQVPKHYG